MEAAPHPPPPPLCPPVWIWKLICKAPTGQYADRLDISLRARRHKPTLEDVQEVAICYSGWKLIPVSHSAENELTP